VADGGHGARLSTFHSRPEITAKTMVPTKDSAIVLAIVFALVPRE